MHSGALRRFWPYAFSAALIAAVLWPLLGSPHSDNFPFSTYPMFSGRSDSRVSISHIVAIDSAGGAEVLPPGALGTDEIVQAFETVRQAIRQGDASVATLCADAADWARGRREEVVSIAVLTETFDAIAYFDGDVEPSATVTHAMCPVTR